MLTDTAVAAPVALFFFAHQDDEFGVFHLIEAYRLQRVRVVCVYLTEGAPAPGLVERRNAESMHVLTSIGVAPADVVFAGSILGIRDATLPDQLHRARPWIDRWIAQFPAIEQAYIPAWEGGHHDHDALHAMVVEIAEQRSLLEQTRQFSLYNSYRCPGPFFKVLTPVPENGPLRSECIGWKARLRHLRLCLAYPSQTVTWIGLFPFVLWHYFWAGRQATQPVSRARLASRPHAGRLYYEYRRFYTWEKMQQAVSKMQES